MLKNKGAGAGAVTRQGGSVRICNCIIADSFQVNTGDPILECGGGITETHVLSELDDGSCSREYKADTGLESSPVGFPPYFRLLASSFARGKAHGVVCAGFPVDARGASRPAAGCDLGAVQFCSSAPKVERSEPEPRPKPTAGPPVYTGYLRWHEGYRFWAQYGLESRIQFQRMTRAGIGIQWVLDLGYHDAIDIWGNADQPYAVCFPQSGRVIFLDAAFSPRRVYEIESFIGGDGFNCAPGDRPGTLVLVNQ